MLQKFNPYDLLNVEKRTDKLIVLLPPSLKNNLSIISKKMNVSRNELVVKILEKSITDIYSSELYDSDE